MKGYSFRSLTDLVLKIFKTKVNAGTGLSGGGSLEADRTLNVNYGTTAGTAAQGNDSRMSDSREWTAATITQAEAQAGVETIRRAFTAQRVRQAVVAYWNSITGVFGRNLVTSTNNTDARSKLGLGTAATRDVGEVNRNVMEVGAFGLGGGQDLRASFLTTGTPDDIQGKGFATGFTAANLLDPIPLGGSTTYGTLEVFGSYPHPTGRSSFFRRFTHRGQTYVNYAVNGTTWSPWVKQLSTSDLLQTTGSSTDFPMSQKATTDALNTKAALSHTHPWSQVSGQPATASRWPTLEEVTDKPDNYPTTWNSVAAKPAQAIRWPTFAEVAGKPETYTPSSHTHPTGQITGLDAALNTKANTSTRVIAGTGLTGGGTIAANRTLSIDASHIPIGVGQTWRGETSRRAYDVIYTNTGVRPMMVSISSIINGGGGSLRVFVDGVQVGFSDTSNNDDSCVSVIVPSGSQYHATKTGSGGVTWAELR